MRIVRTSPCYCTECEAPEALGVRFQNKLVVQQASFALCDSHAKQLASMLLQHTRKGRKPADRRPPARPEPEHADD